MRDKVLDEPIVCREQRRHGVGSEGSIFMGTEEPQMEPVEDEHLPLIVNWEKKFPTMVGQWPSERHALALADPDCCYRLIRLPNAGPVGFLLLCGISSPDRNVELKRIVVETPGHGLGRRVLESMLAMVFNDFATHRLWLDVFEDNARARHLYRSLGFREDGILREAVYRSGSFYTMVLMSILDREYRARRGVHFG
jgi:RimJ/RimL family protein N-acetyltransferase